MASPSIPKTCALLAELAEHAHEFAKADRDFEAALLAQADRACAAEARADYAHLLLAVLVDRILSRGLSSTEIEAAEMLYELGAILNDYYATAGPTDERADLHTALRDLQMAYERDTWGESRVSRLARVSEGHAMIAEKVGAVVASSAVAWTKQSLVALGVTATAPSPAAAEQPSALPAPDAAEPAPDRVPSPEAPPQDVTLPA